MTQYQYVDAQGNLKTIDATDQNAALTTVKGINPNSGVMQVPGSVPTPYPPASTAPQASTTQAPTAGALYSGVLPTYTPTATDTAIDTATNYYKGITEAAVPTENDLFESKRRLFQGEIDAVNKIYADKIASARVQGQGRLGSNIATQARGGLLGSDFGAAQTDTVNTQNREIENAYLNEQNQMVNTILGRARSEAVAEAEAKRQARESGAKEYINFLTSQDERKVSRVTNLAKTLISQGVDISTLSSDQIKQLATSYGVPADSIIASYKDEKAKDDAAKAELAKSQPDTSFTLSEGQERYVLDPATGQYTRVANVAKTYKPTGSTSGDISTGNPAVDNWVALINAGKATISNVPANLKNDVANGLNNTTTADQDSPSSAGNILAALKDLKTAEGFKGAVGTNLLLGFGKELPGSASAGYLSKLKSVQSLLTLPNLGLLKGAMSDNDLKFIKSAGTSLSENMDEKTFTATLDSIITKYEAAVAKQRELLGTQDTAAPTAGTTSSGIKYTIEQ